MTFNMMDESHVQVKPKVNSEEIHIALNYELDVAITQRSALVNPTIIPRQSGVNRKNRLPVVHNPDMLYDTMQMLVTAWEEPARRRIVAK